MVTLLSRVIVQIKQKETRNMLIAMFDALQPSETSIALLSLPDLPKLPDCQKVKSGKNAGSRPCPRPHRASRGPVTTLTRNPAAPAHVSCCGIHECAPQVSSNTTVWSHGLSLGSGPASPMVSLKDHHTARLRVIMANGSD